MNKLETSSQLVRNPGFQLVRLVGCGLKALELDWLFIGAVVRASGSGLEMPVTAWIVRAMGRITTLQFRITAKYTASVADVLVTTLYDCIFVFLFQIKGDIGTAEVFLGRFYGITLLSSCMTWYKTNRSVDATVSLTVMLSRLFVSIFIVIAADYNTVTILETS